MKIRKSINSATGYWADDINAENNKRILQTLAKSLYDNFDSSEIDGVTIYVDDVVRNTTTNGAYKINIYLDPSDYRLEKKIDIISTADGRGKFILRVFDNNLNEIEEIKIPISGCKQAVIDKINELVAGINNSQGVESSMKIRRNRVTANKRRAVKCSSSDMRTQFQSFLDKVDRELDSALFQYGDAVWSVKGTMSNDENGYWFELNLYCDDEEAGTVNIEVDTSSNYRTSTDEYVVSVPDSDEIQAEGNSFDDILDTCVGELIRLAEDYESFVRAEY